MKDFFTQLGSEKAETHHGNPEMLRTFFEQIYKQIIVEPQFIVQPNPLNNVIENEKENLLNKIKQLDDKITDVRQDEEKYRREKIETEEKARKYDLENKKLTFNPRFYRTLQVISWLLVIVLVLVYSIFFMHLFAPPSTKIIPPISEFLVLLENYWLACIISIVPIALGFVFDMLWRSEKKSKIFAIIPIVLLTFALDFIIAYSTHTRIAQANELLGLPSPSLLADTNFWIVIFIGPVPVIILSIVLHFKYKNSLEYIEEKSKNPFLEQVAKLREKEMNRKRKAEELIAEKEELQRLFNKKDAIPKSLKLLPKEQLDVRIFYFYDGWTSWITNFFNSSFEKKYNKSKSELLSQCKLEYDEFLKESDKQFTNIYNLYQ